MSEKIIQVSKEVRLRYTPGWPIEIQDASGAWSWKDVEGLHAVGLQIEEIDKLVEALQEIKQHIISTSGTNPAIPHFQWQRREEEGEARYLFQRQADDALAYSQKWPKTELSTVGAAALPGQPHRDENAVSI